MKVHDFASFTCLHGCLHEKPQTYKKNKMKNSNTKQLCSHLHRMPDGSRPMLSRAQKCSEGQPLHWRAIGGNNFKHVYVYTYRRCIHTYIYIYIYACVCVCVCLFVCLINAFMIYS